LARHTPSRIKCFATPLGVEHPRNAYPRAITREGMVVDALVNVVSEDPVLVGIVVVMLAFVFFLYLMIRRTVTGFKEGMDKGRNG
jgi:hypothetical protein